jgi:hypothetical protein
MNPSSEELAIQEKLRELTALIEQREQVQTRIGKVENAIRAFIELLEDEKDQQIYTAMLDNASKPIGLTETIKRVLRQAGKSLTPVQVRDKLVEARFPLSGYANPLAVIYTTLNRLFDQNFVRKTTEGEYEWIEVHPGAEKLAQRFRKPTGKTVSLAGPYGLGKK